MIMRSRSAASRRNRSASRYNERVSRALPHAIGFLLPPVIVWSARAGGAWAYLPVALLYGVMPVIDVLVGLDPRNPSADEEPPLGENAAFRVITWLWVPVQIALILWGLGQFETFVRAGAWVDAAGLTLSVGLTCGAVGITFAHELIHRPGRFERALGDVLLASVSYPHFAIEHVHGHHRQVGTPHDPATARPGESVYAFLPRTIGGGIASAWRIESRRLAKQGATPLSPSNRMLRYAAIQIAVYAAVAARYGVPGILFFAVQSVLAFVLVEIINYIEHYGLARREIAPGQYERVMPWHSWDSTHRVSNWLLINLARHSDHHVAASKRYQVLHALERAPQLPAGYGVMLLVALAPPLWRKVMDPRVAAWRASSHG